MERTLTYDPTQNTVTWGPYEFSHFHDGSVIEAERDEDAVSKHVGLKGNVTRVKNPNRAGKVTVTLTQGSPTNDDLSAAALLDENSSPGVVYPLTITDAGGRTAVFAAEAWIVKVPKLERGKDLAPAVWVFDTGAMQVTIGGAL